MREEQLKRITDLGIELAAIESAIKAVANSLDATGSRVFAVLQIRRRDIIASLHYENTGLELTERHP